MPLAETQMATVLSNADPEGKDRVRVHMNWQTDSFSIIVMLFLIPLEKYMDGGM